jgi:hypothetical protein
VEGFIVDGCWWGWNEASPRSGICDKCSRERGSDVGRGVCQLSLDLDGCQTFISERCHKWVRAVTEEVGGIVRFKITQWAERWLVIIRGPLKAIGPCFGVKFVVYEFEKISPGCAGRDGEVRWLVL